MSNELAKMEAEARKAYILAQLERMYLGHTDEQTLIANLWSVYGAYQSSQADKRKTSLAHLAAAHGQTLGNAGAE
jgi:hypothetical protein